MMIIKLKIIALILLFFVAAVSATDEGTTHDCIIEPSLTVKLSSPVSGVLASVMVDRGSWVTKNEMLAKIDARVERAALSLAESRKNIQSEIEIAETNLAFVKIKEKRINELYGKKNISEQIKDEAKTELELALLKLEEAREKKKIAELDYERAKQVLESKTILSPIDGVVVDLHKSPGDYVKEDPILTVVQTDPLYVETVLPAEMFSQAKLYETATVIPLILNTEPRNAKVMVIDEVVDAASNTFRIRLELKNPNNILPAGIRCTVSFTQSSNSIVQE